MSNMSHFSATYGDSLGRAMAYRDSRTVFDRFAKKFDGSKLQSAMREFADASGLRVDALGGVALARELQKVSSVASQQPLTDLTSFDVFTGAIDQPQPYQESYLWKDVNETKGKNSHSYRNKGQTADVQVTANTAIPIVPTLQPIGYGIDELARAALGNIPLQQYKAMAAMRAIAEEVNEWNYFGNSSLGVIGFYSASAANGITPVVVATGAAGGTTWLTKTPDEIEADVIEIVITHIANVKNVGYLKANRLVLSPARYALLATTKRSQNTDTYLLDSIKTSLAAIQPGFEVVQAFEATSNTLGGGGGEQWMGLFRKDPLVVGRVVAMEPSWLPPDVDSLETTMVCHTQTGGLCLRYPVAIEQRYGI